MIIKKRSAQKIYLHPGELVISEDPAEVSTVLGSCISVTLYLPKLKIGAICHAVLPTGDDGEPGKYVDQAVDYMVSYLNRFSVERRDIVVKLFGGANMFKNTDPVRCERTVGAQNIREAMNSFKVAGLELSVSDVGGERGRKIIFHTDTGEVFLKRVKNMKIDMT